MIEPGAVVHYDLIGTGYSFYFGGKLYYSADKGKTFYAWSSDGYDYVDPTCRGTAIWDVTRDCNLIMQ